MTEEVGLVDNWTRGPGKDCSVMQTQHYACVNVRTKYMLYNQVSVESFLDEDIPIPNGNLEDYRVLFRRILFFSTIVSYMMME